VQGTVGVRAQDGAAINVGTPITTARTSVSSAMVMGTRSGEKGRREKGIIRLIKGKGIIPLIR
jgi:hypothetical protein